MFTLVSSSVNNSCIFGSGREISFAILNSNGTVLIKRDTKLSLVKNDNADRFRFLMMFIAWMWGKMA